MVFLMEPASLLQSPVASTPMAVLATGIQWMAVTKIGTAAESLMLASLLEALPLTTIPPLSLPHQSKIRVLGQNLDNIKN